MEELRERCCKAAKKYLSIKGAEVLGECRGFIVAEDEDCLVFCNVCWKEKEFPSSNISTLRLEFEDAIAEWFVEHPDHFGDVRCDEIALNIIDKNRAVLRHQVNAVY